MVILALEGPNLQSYLRSCNDRLLKGGQKEIKLWEELRLKLLSYCHQITKGMCYLTYTRSMIHRDLALRNILVSRANDKVVKITDFGLAKRTPKDSSAIKRPESMGGFLPLKWLAPESIERVEFSHKSDVWAFGVTCWEIFMLGAQPWHSVSDRKDLLLLIKQGSRLKQPKILNVEVWVQLILCWDLNPDMRPEFSNLELQFEDFARDPNRFITRMYEVTKLAGVLRPSKQTSTSKHSKQPSQSSQQTNQDNNNQIERRKNSASSIAVEKSRMKSSKNSSRKNSSDSKFSRMISNVSLGFVSGSGWKKERERERERNRIGTLTSHTESHPSGASTRRNSSSDEYEASSNLLAHRSRRHTDESGGHGSAATDYPIVQKYRNGNLINANQEPAVRYQELPVRVNNNNTNSQPKTSSSRIGSSSTNGTNMTNETRHSSVSTSKKRLSSDATNSNFLNPSNSPSKSRIATLSPANADVNCQYEAVLSADPDEDNIFESSRQSSHTGSTSTLQENGQMANQNHNPGHIAVPIQTEVHSYDPVNYDIINESEENDNSETKPEQPPDNQISSYDFINENQNSYQNLNQSQNDQESSGELSPIKESPSLSRSDSKGSGNGNINVDRNYVNLGSNSNNNNNNNKSASKIVNDYEDTAL